MRPASQIVFAMLVLFASMASAHAQSPGEQLKQMVEQLWNSPDDNALREKIIKFAREINPVPTLPDEARRFAEQGQSAFDNAKTRQNYATAAHAYEKALALAPWAASIYFKLGDAYEKGQDVALGRTGFYSYPDVSCMGGDSAEAKRNFNGYFLAKKHFEWYLLASPSAADVEMVKRRIAERDLMIAHWKYTWDRTCCLGCKGIQRNPR